MFEVYASYAVGDGWEQKDKALYAVAGRPSDCSWCESNSTHGSITHRSHGWLIEDFRAAVQLRFLLQELSDINATMREQLTCLRHRGGRR